jgi:hypothetical protein
MEANPSRAPAHRGPFSVKAAAGAVRRVEIRGCPFAPVISFAQHITFIAVKKKNPIDRVRNVWVEGSPRPNMMNQ